MDITRLFGMFKGNKEEEAEYSEEDFDELEKEGGIKREHYTYKYQKARVLHTIEGDFKEWEKWVKIDPRLITVLGMRQSGKSVTCHSLAENLARTLKRPIYSMGMDGAVLPNFVYSVNSVEEVPNDSILVVGEGAITSGARNSMGKDNKNIAKLIPILSHKGIWAFWASQSGFKVDKNLIFEADTIIMHKPSLMQLEGERKAVKNLYDKYLPLLKKYCDKMGTEKGITAVYSEKFVGIVQWKLMDWWNESNSLSYKDADIYD